MPSRFSFTDYALVNSVTDAYHQRWIRLCYDIWCSYGINLLKRVSKHFPGSLETIKKITGAIPKMHVKNHVELCQLLWAFDYIPHSGSTHGEMIETGWAITNEAAGSTKEMNDGHRHDTLDDNLNYYNWTKFHRIGTHFDRSNLRTN
jgi:Kyakuja-Dileera-Zisupton transposase